MGQRSRLTPMHGFLPIFFLLVVLKIPVLGSLWLVWWASKEPEPEGDAADGTDGGFGRRPPFRPRPRGPHGTPAVDLKVGTARQRRRGEETGMSHEPRRHVVREAGNPAGKETSLSPPHTA